VLAAIDEYSENYNQLMNIGARKGEFICDLIAEHKPSVMVELGGYVGYSAILFGDAVRRNGGYQYLSLEINPEMAAVSNTLLELAGLRDFVRVVIGPCNKSLVRLVKEKNEISQIELLFIDHWQELYLPDLWLLEELNVLKPGVSVLAADNVISPGAPKYLEWVRASPAQKREMMKRRKTALDQDGVDSTETNGANLDSARLRGNPNLVYESSVEEFKIKTWKVCSCYFLLFGSFITSGNQIFWCFLAPRC
jgi:catechol O-methyltransferase